MTQFNGCGPDGDCDISATHSRHHSCSRVSLEKDSGPVLHQPYAPFVLGLDYIQHYDSTACIYAVPNCLASMNLPHLALLQQSFLEAGNPVTEILFAH